MASTDGMGLDETEYKKFLEDAIKGNLYKNSYFAKLQLDVIKEKETLVLNKEDEEKLFYIVGRFLKDPRPRHFIDIFTLQKLAFLPPSTPVERFTVVARIICDKVFNYPSYQYITVEVCENDQHEPVEMYTDFCKGFAFLKATKSEGDAKQIVTFEEVLMDLFLEKLRFRFSFRQRLQDLGEHYKGSEEKKRKWILLHSEAYNHSKRKADRRSIHFLREMYTLYPEVVFRAVELLLSMNEQRATHYLWSLLRNLQGKGLENEYWLSRKCANVTAMKKDYFESARTNKTVKSPNFTFHTEKKGFTHVLENINKLLEEDATISLDVKNLWHHIGEDSFLKDNVPQDFIRYCIKEKRYKLHTSHLYLPDCTSGSDSDSEDQFESLTSKIYFPTYQISQKTWKGFRIKV